MGSAFVLVRILYDMIRSYIYIYVNHDQEDCKYNRTLPGNAIAISTIAEETVLKEHIEAHMCPIGFSGYQLGPVYF